ncbi:MAG: 1-acyl-sn-glycerol-3-phosphate acyltransferase [Spirochaetaceae bacterium]|nr:MAG: 1-acyl-sn-glycerol-3-phosphate acyltransferase [Spirochaetaceae bacterium]
MYAKIVFWITLALVILFDLIVYHMRIRGRKNLKTVKNGGFLVSNHSLYLDPGIIAHAIAPRRTFFTAMAPMFDIPFIGHYIRMLGAFPVSETMPLRSLVRVVRSIMDQKKLVHVFPEGDLSHLSREIAPFRDGIFFLAILLDKPILPVVIKTIGQKNPLKIFFKYRIEVTILPPIYPAMFKSEGNDTAAVLREISRHAWTEMTSVMQ